jgi:glycogen synthase
MAGNAPTRVLMTADTVGGVWNYSLQLSAALARYGVEVSLATMGKPLSPNQWQEAAAVPNLTVYESAYKLEWMEHPWDDVQAAGAWLLDLERRLRPDVVHLNGYVHGALLWRAPVMVVGHSCVLSWWEAVKGESAPPSLGRYRHEVRRGLRAARLVVAPTGAMLAALERHYGPLPNTRVIYNGQDTSTFTPGHKLHCVLSVGRLWDEAKNIAALQAVAPRLSWPVYVAGEERHPDGGEVDLAGVYPLGRLSSAELAARYASASIYALPARYEPFGLSVLEAALSGCALVLGDIATLREVWGNAAMFVPPDDTAALHAAIEGLIAGEGLRLEMAGRARQRASHFTTERMAAAYFQMYSQLLGAGATPVPHIGAMESAPA